MSLRELTIEEMFLVAGGGEGNGGDSPGTGSSGGGDGQGSGASGSADGGYGFSTGFGSEEAGGFKIDIGKAARDLGLGVLASGLYDAIKSVATNGPYGPSNPSSSLGPNPDNTPYGSTPMDGYNVDGTPVSTGGTAMEGP